MILNMPANTFFLYYVGYIGQALLIVALGLYWYNKDNKEYGKESEK